MSFARTGLRALRSLPPRQVYKTSSIIAQQRFLSTEARKLIDDAVKANPVVVFMKGTPDEPQCGFSRAVAQILDVQGLTSNRDDLTGVQREQMKTFNVLMDQELREGIKEYSDWPTIPQVYVNGEFVGGSDLLWSMHKSGELESLLVKEGIIPELPPLPEEK